MAISVASAAARSAGSRLSGSQPRYISTIARISLGPSCIAAATLRASSPIPVVPHMYPTVWALPWSFSASIAIMSGSRLP